MLNDQNKFSNILCNYLDFLISNSKIALVSQPYLSIMIFLKFYCGTKTMDEYSTIKVYKSATLDNVNAILKLKMKRYGRGVT